VSAQGWAALAAVVYAIGLVALFGVRTWQHRKATGSSGYNGFAGRDGWAQTAGLLFAVAVLVGAAALVLAAIGTTPALTPRALVQPLAIAGLLTVAVGLGLAWAAQSSMGTSWRIGVNPGETTELVTTGVFARARNPIFTAMVAAQAGTVLMAPSWLSLAALAALVVAIELQVRRVEEPYLRNVHGARYLSYCARAGRFVPLIGRRRAPTTPGGH
jgi:protein-S-isoprenylcysteine O-methyltransferase Ste14